MNKSWEHLYREEVKHNQSLEKDLSKARRALYAVERDGVKLLNLLLEAVRMWRDK